MSDIATKWVAEQAPVEPAERGTHRERIRPAWVGAPSVCRERITTVGGRP